MIELSDQKLRELWASCPHIDEPEGGIRFARAVLAAAQGEADADGPAVPEGREPASVAGEPSDRELNLLWISSATKNEHGHYMGNIFAYAYAVLARWGHPTPPALVPEPVASNTRFEFSVYDEDYIEQAGGSAPTYAEALSWGRRYLAQYQQDGPHTLEVRRVEYLNPGAFPVPDDAPVPDELTHWLPASALPLPSAEVQP